jgi:hypothetical protein
VQLVLEIADLLLKLSELAFHALGLHDEVSSESDKAQKEERHESPSV